MKNEKNKMFSNLKTDPDLGNPIFHFSFFILIYTNNKTRGYV